MKILIFLQCANILLITNKSPLPPFWERGRRSIMINVLYINCLYIWFGKLVLMKKQVMGSTVIPQSLIDIAIQNGKDYSK